MVDLFTCTYQTGKIDAQRLYDILERIFGLEDIMAKRTDSVKFGDRTVCAINGLRNALPETFTREEFILYHQVAVRNIRGEADKKIDEEVEERLGEYVGELKAFLEKLGK